MQMMRFIIIGFLAFLVTNPFHGSCNPQAHTFGRNNTAGQIQQAIGGLFDGCYSDAHKSLIAKGNHRQRFLQNSNSKCVKVCKNKGFIVAATKGYYCYCSNSLPVPVLYERGNKKSAGKGGPCSTVCPGAFASRNCRGDECCGGKKAYSVYIVDSIDILKELMNRIAINFKNNPSRIQNKILTTYEKNILKCQCFDGDISIYLTARSLDKDGQRSIRTVKGIIDSKNRLTLDDAEAVSGLQETQLVLQSVEKLLESEEPIVETPFAQWDVLCDNYFGSTELACQKHFEESAGFSETYSTEHGVSVGVTLGLQFEGGVDNDILVAKATTSFELSSGISFTRGYSRATETTKTEGFSIQLTVPGSAKGEVRFFKSDQPVKVKWRANFFADGNVIIDYGDFGIRKNVHLSKLLSHNQRKIFAMGTLDYGERPTIIARTRIVDRNGNIISEEAEQPSSLSLQN